MSQPVIVLVSVLLVVSLLGFVFLIIALRHRSRISKIPVLHKKYYFLETGSEPKDCSESFEIMNKMDFSEMDEEDYYSNKNFNNLKKAFSQAKNIVVNMMPSLSLKMDPRMRMEFDKQIKKMIQTDNFMKMEMDREMQQLAVMKMTQEIKKMDMLTKKFRFKIYENKL